MLMSNSELFEITEGYAAFRPVGTVTIPQGIEILGKAVAFARENKLHNLLLDTRGLTGFDPPEIFERYRLAERLASEGKSAVKVVVVARPEMIHPEKFGMIVARNRGLLANVFATEAESLAWLLDPNAK
jgi:hypothetical protein